VGDRSGGNEAAAHHAPISRSSHGRRSPRAGRGGRGRGATGSRRRRGLAAWRARRSPRAGGGNGTRIARRRAPAEDGDRLVASLEGEVRRIEAELKALELTKEEHAIVDAIQKLADLRSAFSEYEASAHTKEAFERQIKALARIKDEFVKVQNAAFQHVLDVMSEDISRYYLYLHPGKNENVDDVRLRIVGDEGIEFEYSFHGRKTRPPVTWS